MEHGYKITSACYRHRFDIVCYFIMVNVYFTHSTLLLYSVQCTMYTLL